MKTRSATNVKGGEDLWSAKTRENSQFEVTSVNTKSRLISWTRQTYLVLFCWVGSRTNLINRITHHAVSHEYVTLPVSCFTWYQQYLTVVLMIGLHFQHHSGLLPLKVKISPLPAPLWPAPSRSEIQKWNTSHHLCFTCLSHLAPRRPKVKHKWRHKQKHESEYSFMCFHVLHLSFTTCHFFMWFF